MSAATPIGTDERATRILLVDDDDHVRRMLRRMLEAEGFDVVDAGSGWEALRLFDKEPPDLVVTDLRMPDESGHELIEKLRRRAPGVPVVAISGDCGPDRGEGLAVDAVFAKPFNHHDLVAAIRRLLERAR
jgi:DNA-binding response OmpR family regulator